MDAEDCLKQDRPAILWWRYQHFVVFCGLNDKDEPVICNPSSGRYAISRETFERAFSEIALFNGKPDEVIPNDYWGENNNDTEYTYD
jgi:ABC-type bacteriocin/lantibiotic exporter with double-glycine peptidase domain